ncbi:hypothetical protein [Beihai weivirus-like virus 17]|uniref:hypothetical protein n=1 Tax=Beihai weivirus-like virus 17 TaxID=1922745 RepID=UPI000909BD00|nr:hypothetical protein [Beihai weivirus-like virus 17]APG78088.1 hypothetical protein [Beihai weivirus-like virus 17]
MRNKWHRALYGALFCSFWGTAPPLLHALIAIRFASRGAWLALLLATVGIIRKLKQGGFYAQGVLCPPPARSMLKAVRVSASRVICDNGSEEEQQVGSTSKAQAARSRDGQSSARDARLGHWRGCVGWQGLWEYLGCWSALLGCKAQGAHASAAFSGPLHDCEGYAACTSVHTLQRDRDVSDPGRVRGSQALVGDHHALRRDRFEPH